MAVLPKVSSALCVASQLPGEGPTDVEDTPAPLTIMNAWLVGKKGLQELCHFVVLTVWCLKYG